MRALFVSEIEPRAPRDRWDGIAAAVGLLIGSAYFSILYWHFVNLVFTSDLFVTVQLARSWLEGHTLRDNCFGNHLVLHTYFFTLVFGPLAKLFGVPGLLASFGVVLALAVYCSFRVLRLLGARPPEALVAAAVLVLAPMSVNTFIEPDYFGFHIELVVPALVVALLLPLLREQVLAAAAMALVVCSVKEDAPLAVIAVSLLVLVETWLARRSVSRAALVTLGIAVVAMPCLLLLTQMQPQELYAVNRFQTLHTSAGERIAGVPSLASFVVKNLGGWLHFAADQRFLQLFLYGTFGLVLLRPWALPSLLLSTAVAWVLNQGLLWPPRFGNTLAVMWCVSLLGGASLLRLVRDSRPAVRVSSTFAAIALVIVFSMLQLSLVPGAKDTYVLKDRSPYSVAERAQAKRLFAIYRRDARADEPVVASPQLFRFAHDRNLFWMDRLVGRPRPMWILGDGNWEYTNYGLRPDEYPLVVGSGRFTLRRYRPR